MRETVVRVERSKLVMKPATLSFERTAVLAVRSDVVLFDNTVHFSNFGKRQYLFFFGVSYCSSRRGLEKFDKVGKNC